MLTVYKAVYDSAEGDTPQEKINSMRRAIAAQKKIDKAKASGDYKSRYSSVADSDMLKIRKTVGLHRKTKNIGKFSKLEEPMQLRHVTAVVNEMGLDLKNTAI